MTSLFSGDVTEAAAALDAACVGLSAMLLLSAGLFLLGDLKAYYGRYARDVYFGPEIPGLVDWIGHCTSILAVAYCVQRESWPRPFVTQFLLLAFLAHYVNRSFVHAWLVRRGCKPIPLATMIMGSSFCAVNGLLVGRYLTMPGLAPRELAEVGVASPSFALGALLWAVGFFGNVSHDRYLVSLKRQGLGYQIPSWGLFKYVSGANFAFEITEWLGFWMAGGGPPAATFFFCTLCAIGPRAWHHHKFYMAKFGEAYPSDRRVLIPLVL